MHRFFAALAIFCGWLSIPMGAMAGLIASQFSGFSPVEGAAPPMAVYGVSGIMIFWVYACATLVTSLPLIMATVAPDPRRPLQYTAVVMAVCGVLLLPSELGRAFGLPIIVGAACLWIGGDLAHRGGDAAASFGVVGRVAPALGSGAGSAPAGEVAAGGVTAANGTPIEGAPPALTVALPAAGDHPAETLPAGAVPAPGDIAMKSAGGSPDPTAAAPGPGPAEKRRGRGGRRIATANRTCPWCSTSVPAADPECPNCGAALTSPAADQVAIPGLTEVPPELRRYAEDSRSGRRRPSVLKMIFSDREIPTAVNAPPPSDVQALRPPSAELKAEMARLDAEIAAGAAPPDAGSPDEGAAPELMPAAGAPSTPDAGSPAEATMPEPMPPGAEPGT